MEDLNIKGLLRNSRLAKAIQDASWYNFLGNIKYKAEWYGRTLIQIDRFFESSQLCSGCGYKNRDVKKLSIREWVCPECGLYHDRDENAADNILKEGIRILSYNEIFPEKYNQNILVI